ncbi:MAG: DNA adenine methylase [Myxococcota bacterium]
MTPYPGSTARPFLKWAGGKRRVLPLLLDKAPRKWSRYHEPFMGGGALFFSIAAQKPRPEGWACISDQNERLVRTFLSVRDHTDALIERLQVHAEQHCKEYYYATRAIDIDVAEDVDVAAWLIYLNRTGFNGLYRVNKKGGFNVPMGRYKNPTICDVENLKACSAAMQGVGIYCEGFDAVLDRAGEGDFVYFDPPYVPVSKTSSFTSYTADGFSNHDQERLRDVARLLKQAEVRVMLSNADVPRVRKLYTPGFRKHAIQVTRAISASASARGAVGELIIR